MSGGGGRGRQTILSCHYGKLVPVDHYVPKMENDSLLSVTPNWTIDVSDIRTIKVSNISLRANQRDIREFFSFSGDIEYVEMQRESENSQLAYVTFKDSMGADTAVLLSGATIIDLSVNISPAEDYQLPPMALPPPSHKGPNTAAGLAMQKAEEVVSNMLAKGYVLGKDALNRAKAFDDKLQLTSNASSTVVSLDRRIGLSEKLSMGTAMMNEKVREMDQWLQVSEKTKSALAVAEQKVNEAGSVITSNHYFSTGATWVSSALSKVARAAGDVGVKTKEKVAKAEEEKKEIIYRERTGIVTDFAHIHLDESPPRAGGGGDHPIPTVPLDSASDEVKLGII